MIGIYLIFGFFAIISWVISNRLKSKFEAYSQIPLSSNMSGSEVAKKMLNDAGIYDVKIISVEGQLSDHYNPTNKTVNLSHDVFYGRSIASAAVAAHECGHAVQHARAYTWLNLRSQLVPVLSVTSKYMQWILLAGILLINLSPIPLGVGIVLFSLTTLFSFITLPVEFDASNRALKWLQSSGVSNSSNHAYAQDALKWAAMTYVVAALSSLATLIYYILIFLGNQRRNN
ncbi:MAG: zinc metallopeptidase [Bacteroidia bacterium]|nr:zinc metallopeptidase [Bacteroidia bacterium]MCZ2247802.1 zinc metallopeptidase [Bacteroidia bacterium]